MPDVIIKPAPSHLLDCSLFTIGVQLEEVQFLGSGRGFRIRADCHVDGAR